ncbi:MAG: hypothetical protein EOM14_06380 [Clostridia bacterium]|nr:hypothetical protein [Clostridia bacterium]
MNDCSDAESEALKKWLRIPEAERSRIITSFFCSSCGLTTVMDYSFTDREYGILMKGSCKKCGGTIIRLIEDTQK